MIAATTNIVGNHILLVTWAQCQLVATIFCLLGYDRVQLSENPLPFYENKQQTFPLDVVLVFYFHICYTCTYTCQCGLSLHDPSYVYISLAYSFVRYLVLGIPSIIPQKNSGQSNKTNKRCHAMIHTPACRLHLYLRFVWGNLKVAWLEHLC